MKFLNKHKLCFCNDSKIKCGKSVAIFTVVIQIAIILFVFPNYYSFMKNYVAKRSLIKFCDAAPESVTTYEEAYNGLKEVKQVSL